MLSTPLTCCLARRSDGLLESFCVCADIGSLQQDFRWGDVGNWARAKSANVITPIITVRIAITIAQSSVYEKSRHGLRLSVPCTAWVLRLRLLLPSLRQTATTCSPRFQPGCDHPKVPTLGPTATARSRATVIGADDSHLVRSLLLIHCRLRHQRAPSCFRLAPECARTGGSQQIS